MFFQAITSKYFNQDLNTIPDKNAARRKSKCLHRKAKKKTCIHYTFNLPINGKSEPKV